MTPQSPTAVAKERHGEIGAVDLLHRIIACTHRPNPTDKSRIDIAKGAHRHFERAIEDALALVNADPLSTPSPRIVEPEARIAELEIENQLSMTTIAEERARAEAAEEAENEAKDCFWAVYPAYIDKHGHGISVEAARTEIVDRAINAEHALSTAEARGLERAADVVATISAARGSPETSAHVAQALYDAEHAIRALSTNEAGE